MNDDKWVVEERGFMGRGHKYRPKPQIRVHELTNGLTGVVVPGNYVVRFDSAAKARQYVEAVAQLGE